MTEKQRTELTTVVEKILAAGNDVSIRRKGDGFVVLEVKRTIKYYAGRQ